MGTAVKLIKELEEIGLIEKKRQGQGKPTKIYVKNFISVFRMVILNLQEMKIKTYKSKNQECQI